MIFCGVRNWGKKGKSGGFNLIELMVAVAIAGVIAAVALPAYREQVRKSRRSDATIRLMEIATRQERFFTENNRYTGTIPGGTIVPPGTGLGFPSAQTANGYYTVTINATVNNFSLTATPVGGTGQESDGCSTITYNSTGLKGSTGLPVDDCW